MAIKIKDPLIRFIVFIHGCTIIGLSIFNTYYNRQNPVSIQPVEYDIEVKRFSNSIKCNCQILHRNDSIFYIEVGTNDLIVIMFEEGSNPKFKLK